MNNIVRMTCLIFCLLVSALLPAACKKTATAPDTESAARSTESELTGASEADTLDNAGKDDFNLMGAQDDEYKKMYGRSSKPLLPVYFDFEEAGISESQGERLQQNARYLLANPGINITIEGNCDDRGTSDYNLALGERRAQAARDYLLQFGVDMSRMRTKSYGEERPLFPTRGEASWAENRRDDFVIDE
jgi:peptidoglycan-associated lipoprotein